MTDYEIPDRGPLPTMAAPPTLSTRERPIYRHDAAMLAAIARCQQPRLLSMSASKETKN